jgi:hypothetical protein
MTTHSTRTITVTREEVDTALAEIRTAADLLRSAVNRFKDLYDPNTDGLINNVYDPFTVSFDLMLFEELIQELEANVAETFSNNE